jgi:hypothetical protein
MAEGSELLLCHKIGMNAMNAKRGILKMQLCKAASMPAALKVPGANDGSMIFFSRGHHLLM